MMLIWFILMLNCTVKKQISMKLKIFFSLKISVKCYTYKMNRRSGSNFLNDFKDMHGERNTLVRSILPDLQRKCHSKGIRLVECDLRWGIPEGATGRRIVETCLKQVLECQLFLGLTIKNSSTSI